VAASLRPIRNDRAGDALAETPVEASAPEGAGERRAVAARTSAVVGRRTPHPSPGPLPHVRAHVNQEATHIATLEGRTMVEYTVAKGADETNQIDGNIYVGRIQNVLPGMELAFVDIGIPKNGVLYRGDVTFDIDEMEGAPSNDKRIEEMIKSGQTIICQVTKNAIGAKGARLTQEVSMPGRFAVLVPNSSTIGISKRLPDGERRRLRKIIDDVKPERHGIIIRTAAEGVSAEDLARDVTSLSEKWSAIEAEVAKSNQPRLIYRDLDLAVGCCARSSTTTTAASSSTTATSTRRSASTCWPSTPNWPTASSTTTARPRNCRCSSAISSTSSCTGRSTARSSCPRAGRSSSSAPRRSPSWTSTPERTSARRT
jgi:hypothetical protein